MPRRFRRRLLEMRNARWLVPALRCFTLPLAVRRNRFFVPLCVFIFGMGIPFVAAIRRSSIQLEATNFRCYGSDAKGGFGGIEAVSAHLQHYLSSITLSKHSRARHRFAV